MKFYTQNVTLLTLAVFTLFSLLATLRSAMLASLPVHTHTHIFVQYPYLYICLPRTVSLCLFASLIPFLDLKLPLKRLLSFAILFLLFLQGLNSSPVGFLSIFVIFEIFTCLRKWNPSPSNNLKVLSLCDFFHCTSDKLRK